MIDQNGISNTVSINRVTRTTLLDGHVKTPQVQQEEDAQARNYVSPDLENKKQMREYVVDRIIRHVDVHDGPQYVIWWHVYDE